MSADLSRIRFDPLRDHSGIGIQQGRVWLDADFNEQVAITDRRQRAQVADLAPGRTVVSHLTPDAFKITVSGGKVSIGAGRLYVDGLLAENHGATAVFDPVLGEPNGTGPVAFEEQPYLPNPDQLPGGGPHLVYLDVWERELSHLNTPDLVDSAIGVDTTTRTQIAWQVRVLPKVGQVSCGDTIPAWDNLTAPSPLRLTTGTVQVDPADDPCVIPPGTGYRGPENQLYRVELHSSTTFTWSRDNASVASAVAEVISATSLRLQSLGRDEVLSIKDGDWVEITDDVRELSQASGELRQVTVDPATSSIAFAPALPAPLTTTEHRLRVRRWDSPLISVPADGTPVVLEHGITVTFSFTGTGTPRPGDYWVFAARATAPSPEESLEKLDAAAPRGVHHHYARLALITLPGNAQDCRPSWPAPTGDGCGCEICVTPQQHNDGTFTIQDAVEQLGKSSGGTVVLCPGTYQLTDSIKLAKSTSLRIRGCGRRSRLIADGGGFELAHCEDVVLAEFSLVAMGGLAAILLRDANMQCRIEGLWLQAEAPAIGLLGVQYVIAIRGNVIQGARGVVVPVDTGSDAPGNLLSHGLSISDNVLDCSVRGIDLGVDEGRVVEHTGLTRITGNAVRSCFDAGIQATGLVLEDAEQLSGELDISGNVIEVDGAGIVTGGCVRINDNTLFATTREAGRPGIALEALPPDAPNGVAHVLGNRVVGFGGPGISVTAPMRGLVVKHNLVHGTGGGIVVQPKGPSGNVAVDNNQLTDLRPTAATPQLSLAVGVLATGAECIAISCNTITSVAAEDIDASQPLLCIGIGLAGCRAGQVSGNTLTRIGHQEAIGNAFGMLVLPWQDGLSISDNQVLGGAAPGPVKRATWIALGAAESILFPAGGARTVRTAAGAWTFFDDAAYLQAAPLGHLELNGNTLQGGGSVPAVTVNRPIEVIMTANHCAQPDGFASPAARIIAEMAVVQGNRLRGGAPSMVLDVDVNKVVVTGNITSGGIHIQGTAVENTGKPWAQLNPIV